MKAGSPSGPGEVLKTLSGKGGVEGRVGGIKGVVSKHLLTGLHLGPTLETVYVTE